MLNQTHPKSPQQEQVGEEDTKTINDVSLDLDTFECPICFLPFEAAIFQIYCREREECKNGHATCEGCCYRIRGTCASCGEPVGDIRCRPLEQAIAGMVVPCAFAGYGCARRLRYAEKRAHGALLCPHVPCACPLKGCAYSGVKLYDHLLFEHERRPTSDVVFARSTTWLTLHRAAPFRVLLHTVDERVFLLLNGGDVPAGRSLSVVCLGPPPPAGNKYKMKVIPHGAGAVPALSLSASGPVPCISRWEGRHPADAFLFVPDAYWTSSVTVSIAFDVPTSTLHRA